MRIDLITILAIIQELSLNKEKTDKIRLFLFLEEENSVAPADQTTFFKVLDIVASK